jgi:hypothetical protein
VKGANDWYMQHAVSHHNDPAGWQTGVALHVTAAPHPPLQLLTRPSDRN